MEYFQDPASQRFSFKSYAAGIPESTFAVLRFKGFESISSPYEFEIMLVSGDADLNLSDILQSQASLTIHRDSGDDVVYNGILAGFAQLHSYEDHYFYRAKLVPKLWWLMQTQHNQVFLDQTAPEIIERALVDGGMDSLDYDISSLEGHYDPIDYVCQYSESHFNFVSRWMEREGLYYYFHHNPDGDRLVLSDSTFSHEPHRQGADLYYAPVSGLEHGHRDEIVLNFTCYQKQLPQRIALKDHNPERPSLEMVVRADVDPNGRGESYIYGEHYNTPEEGERLVAIRAEELLCQKQVFQGDSTVPFLAPGFKFNLNDHYRGSFNQEYLITGITHEGDQTNLLKTSVIGKLDDSADINVYSNNFTAIPADCQYRHPKTASLPKVSGTLHGQIDGELDSKYAQLDEEGRYKVKLPFDINDDHMDGKASARIRMMQPYAGENRGMQFPLSKGTEVLLTFIDGNPDRPVIAGAVSTPTAPGPVNADNQSESVIRSAGNNRIRMEDRAGSERIVMESPSSSSWIRVGAPNDPPTLLGSSPSYHQEDTIWTDPGAEKSDGTTINASIIVIESELDSNNPTDYTGTSLSHGIYYAKYEDSGETALRKIIAYDKTSPENDLDEETYSDGLRLMSSGSVWLEAQQRYGSYINNFPTVNATNGAAPATGDPASAKHLIYKFLEDDSGYNPTGLKGYGDREDPLTFREMMRDAHVQVSSLDTVNTQEGNIYDFGGYWNYNLGNSYEEAHVDQSAPLNRDGTLDESYSNGKEYDYLAEDDPEDALYFGDFLSEGGPGWSSVDWPNFDGIDTELPNMSDSWDWTADKVWTTKRFGNVYDYHNGGAVEIHNGSKLDVGFTGHRQVEVTLRRRSSDGKGDVASWKHSESGITKEKKWMPDGTLYYEGNNVFDSDMGAIHDVVTEYDRRTGGIHHYGASSTTGMGTSSFDFNYGNTATAEITAASSLAFEMATSATVAMSVSAALDLKLDITALKLDLKAPISGVTIESTRKGETNLSVPGCSIQIDGPGPTIKVAGASPEFELKPVKFSQVQSELTWKNVNLAGGLVKIFG